MQKTLLILIQLLIFGIAQGQALFPVKIEKKWGLINHDGKLVVDPVYQAIGEFKHFGYAIMQRNKRVGLLDHQGREIVPPKYYDLKVLSPSLIAVSDNGEWMVINLKGDVILNKGYHSVEVWDNGFLAFNKKGKWGLIKNDGQEIAAADYDEIYPEEDGFFLTRKGNNLGIMTQTGHVVIPNIAQEIRIVSSQLIFFRTNKMWGAVDHTGKALIQPAYSSWIQLSDNFIKLIKNNKYYLYATNTRKIIIRGEYDDLFAFSNNYLIVRSRKQLGLVDYKGHLLLPTIYEDIQSFSQGKFRVKLQQKWGVVSTNGKPVIPFDYDYISPLKGKVCMVKRGELLGVANTKGEELISPKYHKILLESHKAKAYIETGPGKELLNLYNFDRDGNLKEQDEFTNHFAIKIKGKTSALTNADRYFFELEKFEWFYEPEEDKWGLRKIADGNIQIKPTFHTIDVQEDSGFTLVGMKTTSRHEFERTSFRFNKAYGLVNNDEGLLISGMDFLDVSLEDFINGQPLAHCIFTDGKHGLINKIGQVTLQDYTYIGEFVNGMAKVSPSGKLSGSMKSSAGLGSLQKYLKGMKASYTMTDFTQYDQLFSQNAQLVCQDCEWGFIDTLGNMVVKPQYSLVKNFTKEAALVNCDGKWGMINKVGIKVIPCGYDGIEFLENTQNKIVRLYINAPKYGMIDTLGELRVTAVYDEVGHFSEGRLSVKRNGLWGFVNRKGQNIIPCRFREVGNFSQGVAKAKVGGKWGFIDKQGNVLIDFKYKSVGNFNDNLAWVKDDHAIYYINKQESRVIPERFDKSFDFKNGVARVVQAGKYGLIDTIGNVILKNKYKFIGEFDNNGLAIVKYGRSVVSYGVINEKGEKITKRDFIKINPFSEKIAVVKNEHGFGYIDHTGKIIIPCKFSKASDFHEGLAAVTFNGNCGYISSSGKNTIDFKYTRCQDFEGEKAVVYQGLKKAGVIKRDGSYLIKPSVDRLLKFKDGKGLVRDEKYRFYYISERTDHTSGYYQEARPYGHGVAVVQINKKWGVINQKGITLIPPKYDQIGNFHNGYAKVLVQKFSGLSDLNGKLIAPPKYEFIAYAGNGLFRAEQGDKIGYLNDLGEWVWEMKK